MKMVLPSAWRGLSAGFQLGHCQNEMSGETQWAAALVLVMGLAGMEGPWGSSQGGGRSKPGVRFFKHCRDRAAGLGAAVSACGGCTGQHLGLSVLLRQMLFLGKNVPSESSSQRRLRDFASDGIPC